MPRETLAVAQRSSRGASCRSPQKCSFHYNLPDHLVSVCAAFCEKEINLFTRNRRERALLPPTTPFGHAGEGWHSVKIVITKAITNVSSKRHGRIHRAYEPE